MVLSKSDVNLSTTPALSTNILVTCQDSENSYQHFHYRSVVGKLKYLENSNWPYIAYAVHQCAQLSEDMRKPYGGYFKRIGRYLKVTEKMGIYIHPCNINITVWVDTDFIGNWFA